MQLQLELTRQTHVQPSPRVRRVAGMFGLGIDEERSITIVPATNLRLRQGQVIFITGPSGGGKSTILRLIAEQAARQQRCRVLSFDALPVLPPLPLVDCLAADLGTDKETDLVPVLRWLSLAGLNDAFVMLRRPSELSDGQRYRLRLAQVMAMVESASQEPSCELTVILADEFAATLDRVTAAVVARNLRKWVTRSASPVCFIAATTHDDLLEHLEPDVLIVKQLGERVEVMSR